MKCPNRFISSRFFEGTATSPSTIQGLNLPESNLPAGGFSALQKLLILEGRTNFPSSDILSEVPGTGAQNFPGPQYTIYNSTKN